MSTNMLLAQWGVLAVLCYGLLAAWADVGAPAFLQRLAAKWKFLFGVLCIAGMLAAFVLPGALHRERNSAFSGKPVSLNWRLRNLSDGKEVSLESFRGKPIFINIWATWCGPCVQEMPSIQALYQRCRKSDAVFVLVSQDRDFDALKEYVKSSGLTAPVYIPLEMPPADFQTQGIPATFFVDRSGKLEHGQVGGQNWDDKYWADILTH